MTVCREIIASRLNAMQIDLSVRANNRNLFSLSAKKYNDRLKFSGSDASMSSSAQRFILNFQSIEVGRP